MRNISLCYVPDATLGILQTLSHLILAITLKVSSIFTVLQMGYRRPRNVNYLVQSGKMRILTNFELFPFILQTMKVLNVLLFSVIFSLFV